jgi:hypothetical protein
VFDSACGFWNIHGFLLNQIECRINDIASMRLSAGKLLHTTVDPSSTGKDILSFNSVIQRSLYINANIVIIHTLCFTMQFKKSGTDNVVHALLTAIYVFNIWSTAFTIFESVIV